MIFDFLRRKYVALTPEEWVRQHFVHFLIEHKGYPKGLIGNEIELQIGAKRLRCDSILYNKMAQPQMIIEYKAPTIPIQQKVFQQISIIVARWITTIKNAYFSKAFQNTKNYDLPLVKDDRS